MRKTLVVFFILFALATVSSGQKVKRTARLPDNDAVMICFEQTVTIPGQPVVLPDETVIITDRPTLKRIRELYESMLVSHNWSEPLQHPRFWLQFFRKGEVVDDWHNNARITNSSELLRNSDLGNCTVENEESICDSIAGIFAASQAGVSQP